MNNKPIAIRNDKPMTTKTTVTLNIISYCHSHLYDIHLYCDSNTNFFPLRSRKQLYKQLMSTLFNHSIFSFFDGNHCCCCVRFFCYSLIRS